MNIFPSFINRDIPSPPPPMDSSKFPQGIDRSSSGESGWTAYIYSSDHDDDGDQGRRKDYEDEEDAESDDSMTSDASSGPTRYQYGGFEDGRKKNERENGGKKEQTEKEKIKAAKDKGDCGARSKKR